MSEIAIVLGLGILTFTILQLAASINNKDEINQFLQLVAYFFLFFLLNLLVQFTFQLAMNAGYKSLFTNLLVVFLWIMRLMTAVLSLLVFKRIIEWAIDKIMRSLG